MLTIRQYWFLWVILSVAGCTAGDEPKSSMDTQAAMPPEPTGQIVRSAADWQQRLTPEAYKILRQSATEPPNGKVYQEFKHQGNGTYHCAGCGALLFSSHEKFDSGCGWPSFYDPAKAANVVLRHDSTHGVVRIEVTCGKCGGHLGHVFEGEGFHTPTDKRYCINGGGLTFVPAAGVTPH